MGHIAVHLNAEIILGGGGGGGGGGGQTAPSGGKVATSVTVNLAFDCVWHFEFTLQTLKIDISLFVPLVVCLHFASPVQMFISTES